MRTYKIVSEPRRKLVELTCSVCGLDLLNDELEEQESVCFADVGGFNSVFGDGNEISIDICQHCFKRLLGDYITIN